MNFSFGVTFDLLPGNKMTWKGWFFSPSGKFVYPGKILENPRTVMPDGVRLAKAIHSVGEAQDRKWVADIFILGGALRILGVDFGFECWAYA